MLLSLEVVAAGEWISAWTDKVLSLNRTNFSTGVPVWEFLDWGAAMEEMPVIFLEPGDSVSVVIFRNPSCFGNVWFR